MFPTQSVHPSVLSTGHCIHSIPRIFSWWPHLVHAPRYGLILSVEKTDACFTVTRAACSMVLYWTGVYQECIVVWFIHRRSILERVMIYSKAATPATVACFRPVSQPDIATIMVQWKWYILSGAEWGCVWRSVTCMRHRWGTTVPLRFCAVKYSYHYDFAQWKRFPHYWSLWLADSPKEGE